MEIIIDITKSFITVFSLFCAIILLVNSFLAIKVLMEQSSTEKLSTEDYVVICFIGEVIIVCLGLTIVFVCTAYSMVT